MSVVVKTDNTKKLEKAIADLVGSHVFVGIPSTKTSRADEEGPITNAALGYIHDNGSPEANIPARPFLKEGVADVQDKLEDIFKRAGINALDGDAAAVEKGLTAAGLVAQSGVKVHITAGIPPPLAESTLAARKRRGVTRTTPLIDTAQLLNSISFVVRKDG